MNKYSKPIVVVVMMLIFATWFSHNVKSDLPLIFQKDLRAHDESSNSVVAANVTRQFFPPMVRVNPLEEKQGNWMEGPYWQHIPPLFAYVPYVFFKLDGQITIEVKRLSYAFLVLLTGLLFIWIIYKFSKNLLTTFAALVASIFWINTPFTHELITGYAFGVSDVVLAFTAVCAFGGLLYYLHQEQSLRVNYSWKKLLFIAFLVALPIMAKNLLGAIPPAVFICLLFWDQRKFNKRFWVGVLSFLGFLAIYYLPLFLSSPSTFKNEILVSFFHASNYEGWGRPIFWYVTNYLPERYLFGWTWAYFVGISLAVIINFKLKILNRKNRILLWLTLGWFVANLVAISLITSKIPNFIYQSYLLSLFAIVWSVLMWFDHWRIEQIDKKFLKYGLGMVLLVSIIFTCRSSWGLFNALREHRAQAYSYNTEREKFYQVGEWMQSYVVGTRDLTIVRVSDNDCWLRYDILFLTGAESKTLLEMHFDTSKYQSIKDKYDRVLFVVQKSEAVPAGLSAYQRIELVNYSVILFDLKNLNADQTADIVTAFVQAHEQDIQQDIIRIKADKTSCQWLVPDEILNAP